MPEHVECGCTKCFVIRNAAVFARAIDDVVQRGQDCAFLESEWGNADGMIDVKIVVYGPAMLHQAQLLGLFGRLPVEPGADAAAGGA